MRAALAVVAAVTLCLTGCSSSSPSPEELAERAATLKTFETTLTDCGIPAGINDNVVLTVVDDATTEAATCFARGISSDALLAAIQSDPRSPGSDSPLLALTVRWSTDEAGNFEVSAQVSALS